MPQDHRQREVALVKVAEDVIAGERFWIVQLDVVHGVVARSERPVDVATAAAQLLALGCDTMEIAQLLADARSEFMGLFDELPPDAHPLDH